MIEVGAKVPCVTVFHIELLDMTGCWFSMCWMSVLRVDASLAVAPCSYGATTYTRNSYGGFSYRGVVDIVPGGVTVDV